MLEILLAVGIALVGQTEPKEKDAKAAPWGMIAKRHAAATKVIVVDDPEHPLVLVKDPVLHRSQEVQGSSKGSVFLWVEPSGRPAAICDVFLFDDGPARYRLNNEWHSLSDQRLRSTWEAQTLFATAAKGLEWQAIPNAPMPADKPKERDRQVRRLAERFTAHLMQRKKDRFALRLLTTPLHRHDTTNTDASLGGALFAFCQQTDPEVLLLIEARKSEAGFRWEYAAAGFSDMDLYLHLDEREVWRDAPAFTAGRGVHSGGRVRIVDIAAELEAAKREEKGGGE